jgi:hypothetical protein
LKLATLFKTSYNALIKNDDYLRYLLSEQLTKRIYPKYKFSEFGSLYQIDETFAKNFADVVKANNSSRQLDRVFVLDQFMKLALEAEGDTAECGVYRGSSSYYICKHLVGTGRTHHAFDSWEGLSAPSGPDGQYWKQGDLTINEQVAHDTLAEFDFVKYYKGWIPTRFDEVKDRKFCLLHLDVDIYQPTLDSLEFFYERLSPGAIVICDDYGFTSCPGAKAAMDEFFDKKKEPVVLLPTGQGLVIIEQH